MNIKVILLVSMVVVLESGRHVDAQGNGVKMADAINGFGIRLYKDLAKTNPNLICSGYGVTTVLNMLLAGAHNATEKELRDLLGYNAAGLSKHQAEVAFHDILTKQRNDHSGYLLSIANSLVITSGLTVLPAYNNTLRNIFYTREQIERSTSTLEANAFMGNATKYKFPKKFVAPIDASAGLILVSALFFNGTWKTKFNKNLTTSHPFNNGSSSKDIQFMSVINRFPYFEHVGKLNVQILELPYARGNTSMVIVLPKARNGLHEVEKKLDLETVKMLLRNRRVAKVHVKIPKILSSSSLLLNDVLKTLGMKNSFTPAADFTGITRQRGLFVSEAIQYAGIEVNEDGAATSGASATFSHVKRQSGISPHLFTADHPFLYFILHHPTGIVLSMGRMTEA